MRASLFRRTVAYPLEALAIRVALWGFGLMTIDRASALGGWIGRALGPRLRVSNVADRNLRNAFPERGDAEIAEILRGMWDNLGRVAAEYAHVGAVDVYADDGRVDMVGGDIIDHLRDDGIGAIFFSGHLGNWELTPYAATQNGLPVSQIYRTANNPLVEPLLHGLRAPIGSAYFPKGPGGARKMIAALGRNEHLGILVDQKLNEGIPVPFFGRPAMTAPAAARLALRFRCPLVPSRVERLDGAHFRLTIYPPLDLPDTGDLDADTAETMRRVNAVLEDWIRERPEQWLWLHRRWPD